MLHSSCGVKSMYYVVIDVFCILVLRSYFPRKEGNSHALALNRCKRMQIGKQCAVQHVHTAHWVEINYGGFFSYSWLFHTSCKQIIMHEKCGGSMVNGFDIVAPLNLFSNPRGCLGSIYLLIMSLRLFKHNNSYTV